MRGEHAQAEMLKVEAIRELKIEEKAYLAGIIDGEGCITISKATSGKYVSFRPLVEITNTNFEALKQIGQILGVKCTFFELKGKNGRKDYHRVVLYKTKQILSLLSQIIPYLLIKKRQAELVANFCIRRLDLQKFSSTDEDIIGEIRKLNKKGI